MPPTLAEKLERLPARPGVYIYRNAAGEPIYIGKAKSLRSRVRSYFQPSAQHPPRIARMVAEVDDLELIVVDTEMEALILESNLIKRERPRYNVVLRDDKHFPYLKLSTNEEFPRLSIVRSPSDDQAEYLGPFPATSRLRRTSWRRIWGVTSRTSPWWRVRRARGTGRRSSFGATGWE